MGGGRPHFGLTSASRRPRDVRTASMVSDRHDRDRIDARTASKIREALVNAAHLIADAFEADGSDPGARASKRRRRRERLPARMHLPVSELDRKRAQRELERLGYLSPHKHR